jgi:hypothetical protein
MLRNPRPSLLFTGFSVVSNQTMTAATGSISDTVNIYMSVNNTSVINWGDGTTTSATATSITQYSHTYSSAASPSISINQPTYIVDLEFELGINFFVNFTTNLNKTIFTNLETFTMTDVSDANWIGDPFTALTNTSLDLGL